MEGNHAAERYLIVDDLVATGKTAARIIKQIKFFAPRAVCIGVAEALVINKPRHHRRSRGWPITPFCSYCFNEIFEADGICLCNEEKKRENKIRKEAAFKQAAKAVQKALCPSATFDPPVHTTGLRGASERRGFPLFYPECRQLALPPAPPPMTVTELVTELEKFGGGSK